MSQKWNLQDIRPAQPRKRRPIPAPTPQDSTPVGYRPENQEYPQQNQEEPMDIVIEDGTKKGNRNLLYAVIAFFVIVGGAFVLSALLGKTELTIYPEHREPNINSDFIAYPEKRDDALSYEILTLESTAESQVTASGQVEVKEQATGMIEIIKTTPGAERLIKNTRFRTPDGHIYRIQESVVVPGAITDENGTSVPGTIQAEVFADQPGEEYNLGTGIRFDIPGFEEGGFTELYNAIYAESRTEITGGFSGPQYQIDENELATARQALQIKLRDELLARIDSEKPAGFVAFPGAVAITYNQLPAVEYGNDLVTIKEQAVLQIPLFDTEEFGTFLAEEAVATYDGGPVRVENPESLTFSYLSATTSASVIANEPSLSFNLTGKPKLIWEYDAAALKNDLAGLPKTAVNNAISAYPGIEGARVSITPFWKQSFPENPEDIIVTEELRTPE